MPCTKTAISINNDLFEQADRLAGKLGISRSQVFARALEEFLQRHTARQIEAAFNRVYGQPPDEDEKKFLRMTADQLARLTRDDEW